MNFYKKDTSAKRLKVMSENLDFEEQQYKVTYKGLVSTSISFSLFLATLSSGLYNPFSTPLLFIAIGFICFEVGLFCLGYIFKFSLSICSHLFIGATIFTITLSSLVSGGIDSPVAIFLLCAPMITISWNGISLSTLIWTFISSLCWILLLVLTSFDGVSRNALITDHLRFVRFVCYITAGLWIYYVIQCSNIIFARRTEAAARDSEHKTHFVAMMSHEIRTPLTTIVGWTDILLASKIETEVRKRLETIKTSSTHLLSVINDILDLTKIQTGKLSFENEPFDLLTLIDSTQDHMQVLVRDGVEYKINYQLSKARYVKGDSHRLLQCIYNFLSNSAKFTHSGSISLNVSESHVDEEFAKIIISITDTGIGMSSDFLSKLFTPFEQGNISTTRKYGGHGLGMTITKQLVECMKGSIKVESTPNVGTTFEFSVVLGIVSSKDFRRHSQKMEGPINKKMLNILLVEDNKLNQILIQSMLHQIGHKCTVANDGSEAINIVQTLSFDLILMDILLPIISGLEASKAIREGNGPCKNTAIIALTASADPWTKTAVKEAGMSGLVAKPVSLDELKKTLNCFAVTLQTIKDWGEKPPKNLYKSNITNGEIHS